VRNKLRRMWLPFAVSMFVMLAVVYVASAQGSCPPGCTCHYVDNQFIVECSGNATSVPSTSAPTQEPGNTPEPKDTREPRETPPPNSTDVPPTSDGNGTQFYPLYCVPLGNGDFGMTCPKNMYDILSACMPKAGCWIVRISCAGGCTTPAPPTQTIRPIPCADVNFGGGGIQCTIGWDRRVSAKIPGVPVGYTPFPRGIVYDPMQFYLAPLVTQSWKCSDELDGWDPIAWGPSGDYRKLVFCLRWRQVKSPEPEQDPAPGWAEWFWDERAWGDPKGELSLKREASHTYVTSSADKLTNGLGNRPSYQVRVRTYWIVEWKENWERRETTCVFTGNPNDVCDGQPSARKTTEWVPEGRAGTGDLREYGGAHFWAESSRIKTPWGVEMDVLPVPVIEVQGVIEK